MKFLLTDIDDETIEISRFVKYRLNKSMDAPCHSLEIVFSHDTTLKEIVAVKAYDGDKTIFDGFCDTQQSTCDMSPCTKIMARSSASILVDSQCMPCSYLMPSTTDIFFHHAQPFGFKNKLPQLVCKNSITLSNSDSQWGVISAFMKSVGVGDIYVDEENNLKLYTSSEKSCVISNKIGGALNFSKAKTTIRRSNLISRIRCKIDSTDSYKYVSEIPYLIQKGIDITRYLNLTNVAQWKRGSIIHDLFKSGLEQCFSLRVEMENESVLSLNDRVDFFDDEIGDYKNLYVRQMCITQDNNGVKTQLLLCEKVDFEEYKYVAE